MKTTYTFIVVFLIQFSFCQAQSFSAVYKQKINVSEKEEMANKKEATIAQRHQLLMKKTKEVADQLEYQLKIDGNESIFKMKEFLVKNNQQHLLSLANIYAKGIFYNNISNSESLWQIEAFGKEYLIDIPQPEWKISKETRIINGYQCKKAEAIRTVYSKGKPIEKKVIAWYAGEIPLSFGPLGYSGLPGLILQLDIEDRSFVLHEMSNKKNVHINKPEEGKEVSLKDYYELYSKAKNNFQ